MKALVLAAGQGTRLRPLTEDRPKCLVPLLGETLLARQAKVFSECGIDSVRVVGGYRIDLIRKAGFECYENERYEHTNMVESLFAAAEYLRGEDDLIISYGDIIFEPDNLRKVMSCNEEMCVMIDLQWQRYWQLRFADPLSGAETLIMDEAGFIKELGRIPESYELIEGQYTGLIKVRGEILPRLVAFYESLDRNRHFDGQTFAQMYMTSFIQQLIDNEWKVKAVVVNNGWLEVDSVADLRCYERLSAQGKLDQYCRLSTS